MFLRKLTETELGQIKKAKESIKKQREELQSSIKKQRRSIQEETKRLKGRPKDPDMFQTLNALWDGLSKLENQRNALPIITGLPVLINVDDSTLCLDYDRLKKFSNSLSKGDFWQYQFKASERSLIIKYQKYGQSGGVEIYELPYLLDGLPTIDL